MNVEILKQKLSKRPDSAIHTKFQSYEYNFDFENETSGKLGYAITISIWKQFGKYWSSRNFLSVIQIEAFLKLYLLLMIDQCGP